jgi:hypothetical protein
LTDAAQAWDQRLASLASPPPLLQSWAWGQVQAGAGWRVERLHLGGVGLATVLVRGGGALRWAYVPRGPVPATVEAVRRLVSWAREHGLARLRVDPEAPSAFCAELAELGFREGPAEGPAVQPRHTLIVALGTEAELLRSFKPKTRYNVRLALRRGVEVEEGREAATLEAQTLATARRQGINLPGRRYYELLLDTLPWCRTYVARVHGRPVAAILVCRYAGRAYYLFGGASGEARELMPSYAVQWAAMRAAADAGCADYDLWGIPPAPDPSHPWHGLWQFKTGFGGSEVAYAGAWDLVISPLRHRAGLAADRARRSLRALKTISNMRLQNFHS